MVGTPGHHFVLKVPSHRCLQVRAWHSSGGHWQIRLQVRAWHSSGGHWQIQCSGNKWGRCRATFCWFSQPPTPTMSCCCRSPVHSCCCGCFPRFFHCREGAERKMCHKFLPLQENQLSGRYFLPQGFLWLWHTMLSPHFPWSLRTSSVVQFADLSHLCLSLCHLREQNNHLTSKLQTTEGYHTVLCTTQMCRGAQNDFLFCKRLLHSGIHPGDVLSKPSITNHEVKNKTDLTCHFMRGCSIQGTMLRNRVLPQCHLHGEGTGYPKSNGLSSFSFFMWGGDDFHSLLDQFTLAQF